MSDELAYRGYSHLGGASFVLPYTPPHTALHSLGYLISTATAAARLPLTYVDYTSTGRTHFWRTKGTEVALRSSLVILHGQKQWEEQERRARWLVHWRRAGWVGAEAGQGGGGQEAGQGWVEAEA